MIIEGDSPEARHIEIVRASNKDVKLTKVKTFNTENKEAEVYVFLSHTDKNGRVATKRDKYSTENNLTLSDKKYRAEVVTARVTLLGYIAIDKRTGKEIV